MEVDKDEMLHRATHFEARAMQRRSPYIFVHLGLSRTLEEVWCRITGITKLTTKCTL